MLFESLTVLSLIATSFAATNLDNLALLVGWLLGGRLDRNQIFLGHVVGMSILFLLACGFGLGANLVPTRLVGYVGILPIAMGLKGLYELIRARHETPSKAETDVRTNRFGLVLSVAATQVGNGVDTLLVFGPLLADSQTGFDFVMMAGFGAMALFWFGLARFLEGHAARLTLFDRFGHWIAPIVLILVGFYILDNTATDLAPGH